MLYTAGEIVLFLVASALIGLAVGFFVWGRGVRAPTKELETLQRQLAATRKRAASAETEVTRRGDALQDAKALHDKQQRAIQELRAGAVDRLPASDARLPEDTDRE